MSAVSSKPRQTKTEAPWRAFGSLVMGLGAFFVSQFVLAVILAINGIDIDSLSVSQSLLVSSASSLLLIIIIVGLVAARKVEVRQALGLVRPEGGVLLKIIGALGIFIIVSAVVASIADAVVPGFDLEQEQDLGLGKPNSSLQLMGLFALLVVLAPISEELLFRGVLFAGFKRSFGFMPAAILSSSLFGLAHWQPNVALATAVLGWLLAYLYHKTGSLWSSIGLHSLKNAVAFVLLYGVSGV